MQINIKNMSMESKVTILVLVLLSTLLIGLSIIAKEILGVLSGVMLWLLIIDIFVLESDNMTIRMLNLLCDVQQELLAEKLGCTRTDVDIMCTERLMQKQKSR